MNEIGVFTRMLLSAYLVLECAKCGVLEGDIVSGVM